MHWLGTDNLGRDILARVLAAGKVDLQIAVVCVMLPFAVGSIVGAVAGYFGGIVDRVISGIIDILWAFPFYVLVIAIVGTLGPSTGNLYLAFTLVVWISFARIVRGEVLVVRESRIYHRLARMLGFSHARIILRHVLPNAITPAIVYADGGRGVDDPGDHRAELPGFGVQPPTPGVGHHDRRWAEFHLQRLVDLDLSRLAIVYTGIAFTLIGDGLDGFLRPKG